MSWYSTRENVRKIQTKLKSHGFDPGPIDGWPGVRTEAAIRAYQKTYDLSVDGSVGPQTWKSLFGEERPDLPKSDYNRGAGTTAYGGIEIRGDWVFRDGKRVRYEPTPNTSPMRKARYLVHHFTAGEHESSIYWLKQPKAKASAHFCISREGEIVQMAPLSRATWHAGKSYWKGINGLNRWSHGIEIENFGQLESRGGKFVSWSGQVVKGVPYMGRHKNGGPVAAWDRYTDAQLEAVEALSLALNSHFRYDDVLGHDEIAPGRKTDPGPAYPMQQMRDVVIGNRPRQHVAGEDRSDVPDTQKRTGLAMAGAGTAMSLLGEQVTESAKSIEGLAAISPYLQAAFVVLLLAGVSLTLWGQFKDMKRVEANRD